MYAHVRKSALINIMNKVCLEVSRSLLRDFNELNFLKANKNVNDFVSRAKQRVLKDMCAILEQSNVGHGIIYDNAIQKKSDTGFYWAINALDSSLNFMHRLPLFGVVIALLNANENLDNLFSAHIQGAVFYDPVKDELFWAEHHTGAFLNSRRLMIGQSKSELIAGAEKACTRNLGSSALHFAYVAAGRLDAAHEKIDDFANIAFGRLIIQEARGSFKQVKDRVIAGSI